MPQFLPRKNEDQLLHKIIRKRFQYPNSILIIKDLVTINGMVTNSPWPSSLGTWVFCFCLFFRGSIALHQPHREPSVVLRDDVSSQRSNFSGGKKYHLHLYIWSMVGQGLLIGWTAGPALSTLGSGPLCSFLMEMRSEQWGGGAVQYPQRRELSVKCKTWDPALWSSFPKARTTTQPATSVLSSFKLKLQVQH